MENSTQDYTIVCGDFNLILDPDTDSFNYKHINNLNSRKNVTDMIASHKLSDCFRELHPSLKRYTWRRKNPLKQAQLDFFLVSEIFMDLISDCNISPGYRTDHSAIELSFFINKFERGRGLWRFNSQLLQNREYIQIVKNVIKEEIVKYAVPVYSQTFLNTSGCEKEMQLTIDDSTFLEVLLLRIRGETIKYALLRKKLILANEKRLIADIENIEKSGLDHGLSGILEDKKTELETIRNERMQGVALRARVEWLQNGEKPSKYFCSLEKQNYIEKTIKRIKLDCGKVVIDQKNILMEVKKFYSILFSKKATVLDNLELGQYTQGKDFVKLSKSNSESLEGELTLCEIGEALRKLKK